MIHRSRRLGAVVLSIGCICAVTACGSSSKSGSGSTGTLPAGRGAPVGFKLTSAEQSCLKKKGVTLPTGGFRGGYGAGPGAHSGKFPKGKFKKGKFAHGSFPKGAHGAFGKQNSKRVAALKACGVSFPSHPSQRGSSTTAG